MDNPNTKRDWRYRLRGDPGAWLLDQADNPSVYFWFQRDIVGRPEDSPSLVQARGDILYSPQVQALFAAQDPVGFWESFDSLDTPPFRATAWALALLAELGLPRTSRRAQMACEFVLQNHVGRGGTITGLDDQSLAGLLARALAYFKQGDARLAPVIGALADQASRGSVFALWAMADASNPAEYRDATQRGVSILLDRLAGGDLPVWGAFPCFESRDAVLALHVLTALGHGNHPRTESALETLWGRQQDGARWALAQSFESVLPPEPIGVPNKWATLNALRVLTKRRG